jgi:hypothetical protein
MTTLSGIITPSNVLTATSTSTLTNKTIVDPILTLGSDQGTAGQVPVSQGAGLPPAWSTVSATPFSNNTALAQVQAVAVSFS